MTAPPHALIVCERRDGTYAINFHYALKQLRCEGKLEFSVWVERQIDACASDDEFCRLALAPDPAIVIVSRLATPRVLALAVQASTRRIPVVVHLDDQFFSLPTGHAGTEASQRYDSRFLKQLTGLIDASVGVWASTAQLADSLARRFPGKSVRSLPGVTFVDVARRRPLLWCRRFVHALRYRRGRLVIGFMGSRTHQSELNRMAPALAAVLSAFPQTRFEVLGCEVPPALAALGGRALMHGRVPEYEQLLARLYELGWDIGIVPLEDNEFNQSKTCTKFVEYSAAHIATVASRVGNYAKGLPPGAVQLVDGEDSEWVTALSEMLRAPDRRRQQLATARAHCAKTLSIRAAAGGLHAAIVQTRWTEARQQTPA